MQKNYYIIITIIFYCLINISTGFAEDKEITEPVKKKVMELPEIEVKSSRILLGDPDKLPVPVQIVTKQEIKDIGATNFNDILELTIGLDLVNSPDQTISPGVKTIRLRGMEINHTLILIDGKRLPGSFETMTGYTFADIGIINVDTIERVEIYRDGPSIKYGADAVAGIVNIITKRHIDTTSVNTQYGISSRSDGNEYHMDASSGFSLGKLHFNFSAFYNKLGHIYRPETREINGSIIKAANKWDEPETEKKGASGSFALDISDAHMLDIYWRYIDCDMDIETNQQTFVSSNNFTSLEQTNYSNNNKEFFLGSNLRGELYKWEYELGFGRTILDTSYEYQGAKTGNFSKGGKDSIFSEYNGNISRSLTPWLKLICGTAFFIDDLDSSGKRFDEEKTERVDETRRTKALFSQIDLTPFSSFIVKIGGRMEDSNDYGDNFTTKISARYELNNFLSFRASAGESYQLPTLCQLYDDYNTPGGPEVDIIGNPDLKPAEGESYNAGMVCNSGNAYNSRVSLDFFYNRIDNKIEVYLTGEEEEKHFTYMNYKGTSEFKGVEAHFSTDLFYDFGLDIKANYLEAEYPDGYDIINRPRCSVVAILSYNFNDRFWGNVRYNYRGKYLDEGNNKIPYFDFLNAQINYAVNDNMTIYLGGRNILDEKSPIDFEIEKTELHSHGPLDSNMRAYFYGGLRFKY